MLLLNELADILTQEVREPMIVYIDPLASLSFAPNLRSFKAIQEAFFEKIDAVHTMSCLAVQDSPYKSEAHLVFVAADNLKSISEELVSTISSSGIYLRQKNFIRAAVFSFFPKITQSVYFNVKVFTRRLIYAPLCVLN